MERAPGPWPAVERWVVPTPHGSPRRCAPRDDGGVRGEGSVSEAAGCMRAVKPHPVTARREAPRQSIGPGRTAPPHGSPRRCAPRDDGGVCGEGSAFEVAGCMRAVKPNPVTARREAPRQSIGPRRTALPHGSPRRFAPRDDGGVCGEGPAFEVAGCTWGHEPHPVTARREAPWQSTGPGRTALPHGSPRRCAPRDDGGVCGEGSAFEVAGCMRAVKPNPVTARREAPRQSIGPRRTALPHGSPRRFAPRDDEGVQVDRHVHGDGRRA